MVKFKMKIYGSFTGVKSGKAFFFGKGDTIETVSGDFPEHLAEIIQEVKEVKNAGKEKVETSMKKEKKETR